MNRINLNIIDFNNKQLELIPNPTTPKEQNLVKITINGITYGIAGTSARVFENIEAMVNAMNVLAKEDLQLGSNIYISTVDVPDLWVSKNDETTSVPYTYTTDAAFIEALNQAGEQGIQIGYYRVNKLETEKVVIPIANNGQLGVIKTSLDSNIMTDTNGILKSIVNTLAEYLSKSNNAFIAKGTLENVLDNDTVRANKSQSLTAAQKAQILSNLDISSEQWTATLTDGTTVTKNILLL